MGHKKQVDTSLLRRAIWNYIHSLYGIRHDDYDYGEINELLDRQLKTYIKTIACYPDRTTKHDYDSFWLDFKHSEKVSNHGTSWPEFSKMTMAKISIKSTLDGDFSNIFYRL